MKFQIGKLIATHGINEMIHNSQREHDFVTNSVRRHMSCDWGDLDTEDIQANNDAIINGARLLSSYQMDTVKIWIITEADRSYTTILFPHEY